MFSAMDHLGDALLATSELMRGLDETGWATASIDGDEEVTLESLEMLGDQLGSLVHGRGGSKVETIVPTLRERAHLRSLSAAHGLDPLPLHVELSHRIQPCRFVAFACLDPGVPSVATTILDRRAMDFSAEERALLRNAVVFVRSGRRSFYSSILPADERFLRFDTGCMEAIDAAGCRAIEMVEDRLARCAPVQHHWHPGDILVLDNWRVLHGRGSAEGCFGRRILRILIDG